MCLSDIGLTPTRLQYTPEQVYEMEYTMFDDTEIDNWAKKRKQLNIEQKDIFQKIMRSIAQNKGTQFFLNARAGTGKTFFCQVLSACLRRKKNIVVTSASSAIASQLHIGGTTVHKAFGVSVPPQGEEPQSSLTLQSRQGIVVEAASLIIIDEVAMLQQTVITAIDRCLRDLTNNDTLFGGKTILFVGDLSQLPPVVPFGDQSAIVRASIISHYSWSALEKVSLTIPQRQASDERFHSFVSSVATATPDCGTNGFTTSRLPREVFVTSDENDALRQYLTTSGFPQHLRTTKSLEKLSQSVLYRSKVCCNANEGANHYNEIISSFVQQHYAADVFNSIAQETIDEGSAEDTLLASHELMESLTENNVPPHKLSLFRGQSVSLLRNFLPSEGLCNGTRGIVVSVSQHIVKIMHVDGTRRGEVVPIFRFRFKLTLKNNFAFTRLQFPLRCSYAGTTHRLQGSTIPAPAKLLFDVTWQTFTHAQTYVALSRVQSSSQLIIVDPYRNDRRMDGVVFEEFSEAGRDEWFLEVL